MLARALSRLCSGRVDRSGDFNALSVESRCALDSSHREISTYDGKPSDRCCVESKKFGSVRIFEIWIISKIRWRRISGFRLIENVNRLNRVIYKVG